MEQDIKAFARKGLQAELVRLDVERARVSALLASLDSRSSRGGRGTAVVQVGLVRRARKMSAEGRKRIQEAVRRRWERVRAEKGTSSAATTANAAAVEASTAAASKAPTRKRRTAPKRAGNRKK